VRVRALPLIGLAAAGLIAGAAEAMAVVRLERDIRIPDLDPRLRGLRIAHVSDLHLGAPGVNRRAAWRALDLLEEAEPDLIAVTGDQLSHARGAEELLALLRRCTAPLGTFAVLGNHDLGYVRDPLSKAGPVPDYASAGVVLLRDATVVVEHAGASGAISGIEPRRQEGPQVLPPHGSPLLAPWPRSDADLHVVLSHYPDLFDAVPSDARDLVLAGHLHGGQLCLPWPSGRIRLSQLHHPYTEGAFTRGRSTMHVSRGVGTTFVPLRFLARPEITILTIG
jgi:predicted MPP superfamily phosphohydrolase